TSSVVRIVEGRRGTAKVRMSMTLRFDYGASVPWVEAIDDGIVAIAGPNLVVLRGDVPMHGEHFSTVAEFDIEEGRRAVVVMSYGESHLPPPEPFDVDDALRTTEEFWSEWAGRCQCDGEYGEAMLRSLLTLKALTFTETGGMVAAPTTSLPEQIG